MQINTDTTWAYKIRHLGWGFVILIAVVASVGFLSLYSAAGGDVDPWASKQMVRFAVGVTGMFVVALIDVRWWYRLAYPMYLGALILLIIVEAMGQVGMGAQRWINLGFI